jgi:hypothetical protein
MKTLIFKMESLFLTIGLLLISLNSNSQDFKLSKQDKKEAKRDKQYHNFQVLDTILQNRSFVLEADWLENQYGNKVPVLSQLNFIMVDSTNAVLQTGSNSYMGSNGVGGATAEGNITGLKFEKNMKTLSFSLRFSISSTIGMYDIFMTIGCDGNARATISALTRGKLIYDGRIETLYNSRVYKGRNSI